MNTTIPSRTHHAFAARDSRQSNSPDWRPDLVSPPSPARDTAMDYLRAFVTLLVLAHHAVLAYLPFAPAPSGSFTAPPVMWPAFPIVDTHRWHGIETFVGFNDIFFMSLMFFLSGLFLWPSLARKGAGKFARDRALRLGLPFIGAAGLLAPLAYYPSYRVTGADPSLGGFWGAWRSLGSWPAGPAWFIWVLLAFGLGAVALTKLFPRWGETLGRGAAALGRRPALNFAALVAVSAAAYVPMGLAFDPTRWVSWGPFAFQVSRILLYATYFLAGAAVGAGGLECGLLAADGKLARRWPLWVAASAGAFILATLAFLVLIQILMRGQTSLAWRVINNFTFVLSCAGTSFALLALFARFGRARFRALDSLSRNAYGMYLFHYAIVSWVQMSLLNLAWPGAAKGSFVFAAAVLASWGLTAGLRRIPAVARVI